MGRGFQGHGPGMSVLRGFHNILAGDIRRIWRRGRPPYRLAAGVGGNRLPLAHQFMIFPILRQRRKAGMG